MWPQCGPHVAPNETPMRGPLRNPNETPILDDPGPPTCHPCPPALPQDNVPGFGGDRAIEIIEAELGKPIGAVFESFEREPIAAASLGQVHRATYKGQPVAVKVQRKGLKELFDTDLKNLKVLVKLLDKFDPKTDGADRSYADIYDESAKLLYEEIDYTLEGKNAQRFKDSFDQIGVGYIRVPNVYWEVCGGGGWMGPAG